jgi:hypothetical protein
LLPPAPAPANSPALAALADRGARMRKNRINRITDWIGTGHCLVERGTSRSLYVFVLNPVQSLTEP